MNNVNEKILDLYKIKPKVLVSYKVEKENDVLPKETKCKKVQTVFMEKEFFNEVKKEDDYLKNRNEKYRFITNPGEDILKAVSNYFSNSYNQKEHGYSATNFNIYDIKKYNNINLVLVQIRKMKLDKEISNNDKKTTLYFLLAIENNNILLQKRIKYFSGLFIHSFIIKNISPIHMIFSKDEESIISFKTIFERI